MKHVLAVTLIALMGTSAFASEGAKVKPVKQPEIQSHHATRFVVGIVCPKIIVGICHGTVVDVNDDQF